MTNKKANLKGIILILDTIDNLGAGRKVFIEPEALRISNDSRVKLHKKSQYLCPDIGIQFGGFLIPLLTTEEGDYVIDFSEVNYLFAATSTSEFNYLSSDEWIEVGNVETKKVASKRDAFVNYSFVDLQNEFINTVDTDEEEFTQFLSDIKQHLSIHINRSEDDLILCSFADILEERIKKASNNLRLAQEGNHEIDIDWQRDMKKNFKEMLVLVQTRQQQLNLQAPSSLLTEEEQLQADFDAAIKAEDYELLSIIKANMESKGYTPKT